MPEIVLVTLINAPTHICFDLARSIDLHETSTAHTGERAIAGRTSGLMELGETVTWRAKHLGVWQTLTSRITAMERPTFFVDEMVEGAFARFRHEHLFEQVGEQTRMIDRFDYTSPLGIIGRMADVVFLKQYMTQLLTIRNNTIKDYAESDKWREVLP